MNETELAFTPAVEQARLVREKRVSPLELLDLCYSRIERLNPTLSAFTTLDVDRARAVAVRAEAAVIAGEPLGPLHGVPVGIKENEITEGIETTWGSLWMKGHVPSEDSVVVERLKAAGAIVIGKTNMPDWGVMIHMVNKLGPPTRNPWGTGHTSGGSSSGSAAGVAAGLCALASGTDGGGSIRAPASFCGVFGIRPTLGRVPRYTGVSPTYIANQFSQPGSITRTVGDAAVMLGAIAGYDARDPDATRLPVPDYSGALGRGIEGLRIAYSPDYGYATVNEEVAASVEDAVRLLERLGADVEHIDLDCSGAFDAYWPLICANQYASAGGKFETRADELTPETHRVYEYGSRVTAEEYARSLGALDQLKARFDDVFENYDLLVSPTMPTTAFLVGEPVASVRPPLDEHMWGFPADTPFTYPINAIGLPGASVPCGFDRGGLPIGLQAIGRRFEEPTILALAAAFERERPWADTRPPVS
jgi:Asp-tRNA(Asn)/Glu-tRNA(Gln) amidotransferase A subunit family amidase